MGAEKFDGKICDELFKSFMELNSQMDQVIKKIDQAFREGNIDEAANLCEHAAEIREDRRQVMGQFLHQISLFSDEVKALVEMQPQEGGE